MIPSTTAEYIAFVKSEDRLMVGHDMSPEETEVLALSNALGGETGELQNIVKKIVQQDVFLTPHVLHDQFILEAGDVMWYLCRLIQVSGYTVDFVMQANMDKLRKRANEETSSKPSPSFEPSTGESGTVRNYQW
jgi:hypothetical protein